MFRNTQQERPLVCTLALQKLSKKKTIGRPRLLLDSDYSSAVEDILLYNNEHGEISTVKRTMAVLEQAYHIKVSYSVLLRDIHALRFKYQKGTRINILHDAQTNVMYRGVYVKERLANINGKFNPDQPEVFLDESYCHVDHSTQKTWVRPRGVINEKGRKPMLVIFAAFIVFKEGHGRRAQIIPESIHVWPVQGGNSPYVDYHGYFDAEKFERLFETICRAIEPYGSCVIHMDGASYHKRRTNRVPTSATKKNDIVDWFLENNLMLPNNDKRGKMPTKATLLQAIKDMRIQPQFACYDIASRHGHRILFTPPYHPEVQPIEKVWAMIKNPIAYNPDPKETVSTLTDKLVKSLEKIPESSLLSVWKKSVDVCVKYYNELNNMDAHFDLDEEDEDVEMVNV